VVEGLILKYHRACPDGASQSNPLAFPAWFKLRPCLLDKIKDRRGAIPRIITAEAAVGPKILGNGCVDRPNESYSSTETGEGNSDHSKGFLHLRLTVTQRNACTVEGIGTVLLNNPRPSTVFMPNPTSQAQFTMGTRYRDIFRRSPKGSECD
jgi:hypothetical protein